MAEFKARYQKRSIGEDKIKVGKKKLNIRGNRDGVGMEQPNNQTYKSLVEIEKNERKNRLQNRRNIAPQPRLLARKQQQ